MEEFGRIKYAMEYQLQLPELLKKLLKWIAFGSAQSEIEEYLLALVAKRRKMRVRFEVDARAITIAQSVKKAEFIKHLETSHKNVGTWFLDGGQS